MSADTSYSLTGEFQSTLGRGLSISVANLSTTGQLVTVTLRPKDAPDQVAYLRGTGDSIAQAGDAYESVIIEADTYPCSIALGILPGPPPIVGVIGAAVTQGTTIVAMRADYVTCSLDIAYPLPALANVKSVMIKADPSNAAPILVSQSYGSAIQYADWPLSPGEVFRADTAYPLALRRASVTVSAFVWQGA